MKRLWVLGTIIGTGLLAITVAGQQPPAGMGGGTPQPPLGTIQKLTDSLYWIPGAGGNSAVFVMSNGVLLVDTKNPDNGQGVLDQIRTITDKPVTHIINTHTHGDHTGSNVFFPASVEVVAQENTKANMEKMPAFQSAEGKVGLPDRVFKDRLTLFSGKDAVDLYYFGAAHTNGDAFVVFRDARVMHAADVFARKGQPYIDTSNGGSAVAIGETIAKAATTVKNVDRVITGHDAVYPWQDFVLYGDFNRTVAAHARASLAAGKTVEQAVAEFKLPERFTGYAMTSGFGGLPQVFNVLYAELGKK
jgi:cyclase